MTVRGFGRQGHLLTIKLAAGVTVRQAVVLVIIGIMQPYVLENQLHLDTALYGRIAGTLALVQNVTMILSMNFLGSLSDRIGRKPLIYFSMSLGALGCLLYPFLTTLTAAIAVNVIVGLGMSAFATTGNACVLAYPDNSARGAFVSMMAITQGIATSVVIGLVGPELPAWLASAGFSPLIAGGAVFWLLASICLVGIFAATFGFEPREAIVRAQKPHMWTEMRAVLSLLAELLRHAREKPRFGMLLLLSCAFRADLVVVLTFLSLWVIGAARGMGIDSADVLGKVGALLIILQVTFLSATAVAGWIADRFNRSRLLLAALTMGGAAFLAPLLVTNVLGWQVYAVVVFLGFSEGVSVIATLALLGQETPPHLRGSATGAFSLIGMLGAIGVNSLGGVLFDKVSFVAPFVMVGVINLACLFACMLPGRQSFRPAARA
jgi:MFS family permease